MWSAPFFSSLIAYYEPVIVSAQEYYPFGMMMRQSQAGKYRYGFNGKENDNEVKGLGNQQDYGLRIYDPRLGKFLSVDPLPASYPWYTPYQFAGNTPIQAIDLDGGEPKYAGTEESQKGTDEIVQGTGMGGYGKVVRHWIWHKGGLKKADGTTTKADWYTSEDYLKTLSSTNAAATLAGDMNLYSNAALSNQKTQVDAGRNENAAKHLIVAAKVRADNANFNVTGTVYQSSFNVEDILGAGIIMRQGLKLLAGITIKSSQKLLSPIVAGIEQSALDRVKARIFGLADRKYSVDAIKAFGSRTKGTHTVASDVDIVIITDQAREMLMDKRISNIIKSIKDDFYQTTKKELDISIFKAEDIGPKTLFKRSDLKSF